MHRRSGGGKPVDPGVEARASELSERMIKLASKVELAEQFLACAAHEMKTPLANVRGELQLALMRERTPEEYRQAMGLALEHTQQLIDLTNDLLMFAKITYTSSVLPHEPITVRAAVLDALDIAAQRKGERSVKVNVDDRLVVDGRPEELTRLFRNLLDNAFDYAPAGGVVAVNARQDGDDVVVAVEDSGPALAAELAEVLFLPFRRGSSVGGGGFGLGLSIARAIARSHGGELVLDTTAPNVRFLVRLPLFFETSNQAG
jgi:two-component system, OmpR family, sensor kinase